MTGFSKELWMQTWMATEEAKAHAWMMAYREWVETGKLPSRSQAGEPTPKRSTDG